MTTILAPHWTTVIVRSCRRYDFDADRSRLWEALGMLEEFRRWWPWLRRFDGARLAVGERWRCTVAPPLPYEVTFTVTIDEVVVGRRVRATVEGDVLGSAAVHLEDRGDGCRVRLEAALEPGSELLRGFGRLARPLVERGHDWVLDTGARQFREHALPRSPAVGPPPRPR